MDEHLGYAKSENNRNGYLEKQIKDLFNQTKIRTPRDRKLTYNPIIISKNQSNIANIEQAIIKLYSKGTSTKNIVDFIESTYRFKSEHTSISRITDKILPDIYLIQSKNNF